MDGLSGAASGIAVVSLTFQIVESISKLRDFFDSMKMAPAVVELIAKDLAQLSSILDGIKVDVRRYSDVLTTCMEKIKDLNAIIEELEPGFQSANQKIRKWAAFRTARKGAIMQRFRVTLEETKSTLVLALQAKSIFLSQASASQMELMERRMCEGWTENQQQFVELISRQNQLSGSVHSLADQLASLSVEHRSWLISTRSVSAPLNFSDHSADLQEEIIRMRSEITNPIIRRMFETGVKSATASHLEKMTNEQPMSQKARWSGREEPNLTHRDVVAPPNLDSNISNQWSREVSPSPSPTTTKSTCKRRRSRDISPSPNTTKSICRRRRIRRGFRNTTSINEFFGGTIYIRSDTYEVGTNLSSASNNSDILETETAFIYHPAAWLLRRCFAFGVRALVVKAAQGWKYQLSTFRAVPDNSLIFEFCEDGNLEGVRSLLARREASPWDVNSLGGTPLHVASHAHQAEVCELLLREGGDPNAKTYNNSSTFSHACYSHPAGDLGVRRQFATLRLLSPYLEVEEEQYGLIWNLIYNNGQTKESKTTRQLEVLKWVLELCRSELEEYPLWRMLTTLSIDIESVHAGISPRWDSFKLMTFLADLGANLHRVGYGNQSYDVAGPQSPTVLSMRTSFTFFHWRKMLEKGYDVESFVTNELQNSPLVSQGWTKETLVALFEYDFVPYQWEFDSPQLCRQCGNSIRYPREILWERKLEMIRQGGVLEVEELDNRSTNGLLSRDGICGSSVGSDSVASAPAGTMDSKAICAEYDGPRPVSSGDEYVDTRSSWTTDNRPFRSLCDFCDMKPKLASEREESEEDFRPNMPGSFDI